MSRPSSVQSTRLTRYEGNGYVYLAEKFLPRIELRTPIVAAQLQNEAGIIGAALHATQSQS